MAAPSQYYVDPVGGNDSTGNGTIGTPWKSVQWALDHITRDADDGDQINIKGPASDASGTDDTIAASLTLTTYGTPAVTAPLILRGYGSAANDGVRGGINVNGQTSGLFAATGTDYVHLIDLFINNGSATTSYKLCTLDDYIHVYNCKFANGPGGLQIDNYGLIEGCEFTDLDGAFAVQAGVDTHVINCYFKHHVSNNPTECIITNGTGARIEGCVFSLDSDTLGIVVSDPKTEIAYNSFYGAGTSTGKAIVFDAATHAGCVIRGNIISQFKGAGAIGIDYANSTDMMRFVGNNAFYDNTDDEANEGDAKLLAVPVAPDNESLAGDPYAKSGADTSANRLIYFAPNSTGGIRVGGGKRDKGAVQHADSGAGGGRVITSA